MKNWTSTSGLKASNSRANWLWLWLLLLPLSAAADTPPDLELLEFLGEWQDDSGQWLDPLPLSEESVTAQVGPPSQPQPQPEEQANDD